MAATTWKRTGTHCALGLSVLLACASCGFANAVNSNNPTLGALLADHFLDVRVSHSPTFPGKGQSVNVDVVTSGSSAAASADGPSTSTGDQSQAIAKDTWDSFPYYFDTLSVTIVGNPMQTFTHSQLLSMFGTRPGNLDAHTLAQQVNSGLDSLYAVLAAIVVLLAIHVIHVEIRHRRVHKDRVNEEHIYSEHYDPSMHAHHQHLLSEIDHDPYMDGGQPGGGGVPYPPLAHHPAPPAVRQSQASPYPYAPPAAAAGPFPAPGPAQVPVTGWSTIAHTDPGHPWSDSPGGTPGTS